MAIKLVAFNRSFFFFSGHGFKLAPVVGKILSELATGQEPSYDISALRISRFGKSVVSKASL